MRRKKRRRLEAARQKKEQEHRKMVERALANLPSLPAVSLLPPANPTYQEIVALHGMLDEAGIDHLYYRVGDGWRIVYPANLPEYEEEFTLTATEEGPLPDGEDSIEVWDRTETWRTVPIPKMKAKDVFGLMLVDWRRRNSICENMSCPFWKQHTGCQSANGCPGYEVKFYEQ